MATKNTATDEAFTIERHGDVTVIMATPALERLSFRLEKQAADLILEPIQGCDNPLIVFDLSRVNYFGSMFLALLIRTWKLVTARGGTMAISGVTARTRELLRVTSLDIVWPIYDSRNEAVEALLLD
jgi:anti-anti-sigma factor